MTAPRDYAVEATPASEHIANALQMLGAVPVDALRYAMDNADASFRDAYTPEEQSAYAEDRERLIEDALSGTLALELADVKRLLETAKQRAVAQEAEGRRLRELIRETLAAWDAFSAAFQKAAGTPPVYGESVAKLLHTGAALSGSSETGT